ncbi:hypothetical protein E2C01_037571 [Portunus trituberculatus]|uniref:Uncharacterized protein n=1 Tax=Portunus trituberculatus TaxID=210409 RepID=A0A5B7FEF2_PORTR|nr:hypothetical protein [Portunus trituberculatus]
MHEGKSGQRQQNKYINKQICSLSCQFSCRSERVSHKKGINVLKSPS